MNTSPKYLQHLGSRRTTISLSLVGRTEQLESDGSLVDSLVGEGVADLEGC